MKALIVAVMVLLPTICVAQETAKISVSGSAYLRPMVQRIAEGLDVPLPSWGIVILTDAQWAGTEQRFRTGSAFTIITSRHTFISERFIRHHSTAEIRHTLAHEVGHIICDCFDERIAETFANSH